AGRVDEMGRTCRRGRAHDDIGAEHVHTDRLVRLALAKRNVLVGGEVEHEARLYLGEQTSDLDLIPDVGYPEVDRGARRQAPEQPKERRLVDVDGDDELWLEAEQAGDERGPH